MGGTDLLAAGAVPLTLRLLDPGEAGDLRARVAQHPGQDVAATRASAPARHRPRIRAVSGRRAVALPRGEPRLVQVDQGQGPREGLLPAGVIAARHATAAVRGLGHAAQGVAEVRLAAGMLEGRLSLGPRVQERIAAAYASARGAHPARVDGSLRKETAAPQGRNVVGLKAGVLGVAAVHRPPVEGMAPDDGPSLLRAEIGQPGPR